MIRLLILAYTSLLLLGLSDNMRGPLYPEILTEFQLSDAMGSWFFSLSSIVGFFAGLTTSRWIRRIGTIHTLQLAILICGFSQFAISHAESYSQVMMAAVFFGWSMATMGVVQNFLVVTESPEHLRNRILSGLHSMYGLASLLAPLLVHFLATQTLDKAVWRQSFLLGSSCSLAILILSFGLKKKTSDVKNIETKETTQSSLGKRLYFGFAVSGYVLAEVLVASRIAQYVRSQFQYDLSHSSLFTAGFFVCLLAGRLLFSFWVPKVALETQLRTSLALTILSLLAGLWISPYFLALAGFFMGPFYPLTMVEAGRLFRGHVDQALSICVGLSAMYVVLMQMSFGWLNDQYGISTGFYLAPLFCVITFAMLAFREKVFR